MEAKKPFERLGDQENFKGKAYGLMHKLKNKLSFYPAACIAGFDDEEAWQIRDELIEENPDGVVQGLAGITTEKTWDMRESLIEACPHSVARSLVGLDDKRAWEIREKLSKFIDNEGVANGLAESVAFLDSDKAWELRYKLENVCLHNVLEGLVGVDSDKAWDFREKHKQTDPNLVAFSLFGIKSERSNEWRNEFVEKGYTKGVIGSYTNDDSPEAWELRDKFLEKYPFAVATSLAGIDNERAWNMRNKVEEMAMKTNDEHIYKGLAQSLSPYMLAALKTKSS